MLTLFVYSSEGVGVSKTAVCLGIQDVVYVKDATGCHGWRETGECGGGLDTCPLVSNVTLYFMHT